MKKNITIRTINKYTFLSLYSYLINSYNYFKNNKQTLFAFIFKCSKKVNNILQYTKFRNHPIDFNVITIKKYIEEYLNKNKPSELINNSEINFLNVKIKIKNKVFIPRVDSEQMVKTCIDIINKKNIKNVCDICTGSGAIALAIKKNCVINSIDAIDINDNCIKVAINNAKINNIKNINFIKSDYLSYLKNINIIPELIVCNPPYVNINDIGNHFSKYENIKSFNNSLNELSFYVNIIGVLNKKTTSFCLVMEFGSMQKKQIEKIIKNNKMLAYTKFYKDVSGRWRYFVIDKYLDNNKLRTEAINSIKCIGNRDKKDKIIVNKIISFIKSNLNIYKNKYLALYYPLANEPNTLPIIEYMLKNNLKVCIPYINNNIFTFKEITKINFSYTYWKKIKQPTIDAKTIKIKDICTIIAPCILAFNNYRLGYGSNFYNKILLKNQNDIYKIIIGYKKQEKEFTIKKHYIKFDKMILI